MRVLCAYFVCVCVCVYVRVCDCQPKVVWGGMRAAPRLQAEACEEGVECPRQLDYKLKVGVGVLWSVCGSSTARRMWAGV